MNKISKTLLYMIFPVLSYLLNKVFSQIMQIPMGMPIFFSGPQLPPQFSPHFPHFFYSGFNGPPQMPLQMAPPNFHPFHRPPFPLHPQTINHFPLNNFNSPVNKNYHPNHLQGAESQQIINTVLDSTIRELNDFFYPKKDKELNFFGRGGGGHKRNHKKQQEEEEQKHEPPPKSFLDDFLGDDD